MNCITCQTNLTWRENKPVEDNSLSDRYIMQSIFTCSKCNAYVEFFYKR